MAAPCLRPAQSFRSVRDPGERGDWEGPSRGRPHHGPDSAHGPPPAPTTAPPAHPPDPEGHEAGDRRLGHHPPTGRPHRTAGLDPAHDAAAPAPDRLPPRPPRSATEPGRRAVRATPARADTNRPGGAGRPAVSLSLPPVSVRWGTGGGGRTRQTPAGGPACRTAPAGRSPGPGRRRGRSEALCGRPADRPGQAAVKVAGRAAMDRRAVRPAGEAPAGPAPGAASGGDQVVELPVLDPQQHRFYLGPRVNQRGPVREA